MTLALGILAAVGCGGGGGDQDDDTVTPVVTREATSLATPPREPTPAVDIREINVAAMVEVQAVLTGNGGTIVQADVVYADVTGDGFDDAIVPVSSGGTLGYVGFFVITPEGEKGRILLQEFPTQAAGLTVTVVGERIEMLQPAPGPDDPECCPSFLRRTIYGWNGNALAVESVTMEPSTAPAATPTPDATQ